MLEIKFQNKTDDFKAFAEYMAKETFEGKRIGSEMIRYLQFRTLNIASIGGLLVWSISNNFIGGAIVFLAFILLGEAVFFLETNFNPRYFYAKRTYLNQEKHLTEKQKNLFILPRKLIANEEYIEISSPVSLRRCNWICIEKIDISTDFIFIHIGGCPITYIPKRDFQSEQIFKEFGEQLIKYQQEFEAKNAQVSTT